MHGTSFFTGGVLECSIAHRRFVVESSMLYKIRCNLMYPLYGAVPACAVCARAGSTWSYMVAHRYTYAPSRCSISVERSCCSCVRWCWTGAFKENGQCLLAYDARSNFIFYYFPYPKFHSMGWYCMAGVLRLIRCKSLFPSLALPTFLIYNNNDNNNNYS